MKILVLCGKTNGAGPRDPVPRKVKKGRRGNVFLKGTLDGVGFWEAVKRKKRKTEGKAPIFRFLETGGDLCKRRLV